MRLFYELCLKNTLPDPYNNNNRCSGGDIKNK